ncbi:putative HIT finger domain protein [Aspergillus ruber CBS 135680]|uniref:Putative HIT finger domain protein n=1 Tax=Aspergillus ruber (strain CBS 135680) TaxID=1388766 RepID=A0A017S1J0_ASPRC|nr:putative HIT finger domain protein [Aspergillus ruber CBS 135680]EYE90918.1 putative HIT finger domain protein [Aspergillus ruber CBS 135680]
MYHIELLPNSTSHITPGWTYVPDRGFDPAKAAITPAIGRKRGIRDPGGRGDLSSRENNAIIRHLAELDRENHRDVQIAVPVKQKEPAGRGTRGKTTTNTRRILQSQKTFRNHLDDEEAHLSQTTQTTASNAPPRLSISSKVTKPSARRSSTPLTTPKTEPATKQRKQSAAAQQQRQQHQPSEPPAETSKPDTPAEPTAETETELPAKKQRLIASEYDNDPLLRSRIPSAPSERIMQALLSEPPLSYNAARAGPPVTKKAPRFFCCICGYWGKIRCRNCHVRMCGLGCYKVHEDSRCGAFL